MPFSWLSKYLLANGRSVPFSRRMLYCSGVSCFFHSSLDLTTLSVLSTCLYGEEVGEAPAGRVAEPVAWLPRSHALRQNAKIVPRATRTNGVFIICLILGYTPPDMASSLKVLCLGDIVGRPGRQ